MSRSSTRAIVEDGLRLSLSKLMCDQMVRPGVSTFGTLNWTIVGSGEKVASMHYQTDMAVDHGRLRLRYTTTRYGDEKILSDYWIQLITTAQPFGGLRWWFVCPYRGARASKLYLPQGATRFASRGSYRMTYRSQCEAPHDRALSRAQDMRRELGGSMCLDDMMPDKPKWMRWPTYERKTARIEADEAICDARLSCFVSKLGRHL